MTAAVLVILGAFATGAILSVCVYFLLHRNPSYFSFAGQTPSAPVTSLRPAASVVLPEKLHKQQTLEPTGAWCVSGLTKIEAEEVLDWLESHGHTQHELLFTEEGFAVRFKLTKD